MARDAVVTVLVPAYEAEPFLDETLASIARQHETRLAVLVADDASTDATARIAESWTQRDPRFRLYRHAERLGWVDNVNWLLRHVDTDSFCLLPHDDLLQPAYLERTLQVLRERPEVVCAYSDLAKFGAEQGVVAQAPLTGSLEERFAVLLRDHYPAVAFRGLTRTSAAGAGLHHNAYGDRFSDTVWFAQLAAHGDLWRIPEPLYRKRYLASSVHAGWLLGDPHDAAAAWVAHCVQILAIALDHEPVTAPRLTLVALARALGLVPAAAGSVRDEALSQVDQSWLLARFLAEAAAAGLAVPAAPVGVDQPILAAAPDLALARADAAAARAQARHEQALAATAVRRATHERDLLAGYLARVLASRSWRMTGPLRSGAALFQRRRG